MPSAPSKKAFLKAHKAAAEARRRCEGLGDEAEVRAVATEAAVEAAHDPALGLDRSVCLRAVVEVVDGAVADVAENEMSAADALAAVQATLRSFGEADRG